MNMKTENNVGIKVRLDTLPSGLPALDYYLVLNPHHTNEQELGLLRQAGHINEQEYRTALAEERHISNKFSGSQQAELDIPLEW